MADITAIGELLIDLTQTHFSEAGIPQFSANPGGAPANVAVAASRLGAETAFIGKVGHDGFGAYLQRVLEENQVGCKGIRRSSHPTTMAIVTVDRIGERSFEFIRGADIELWPEEVDEQDILNTRILHFGSVSLTPGMSRSATVFAARTAHRAGKLVSYDPNYRPALWRSERDAKEWMTIPLPLVDIIKLSEEEVFLLTGEKDLETGGKILEEKGISLVLITLGGEGVLCRWKGESFRAPGVPVQVADTNGAGDTFLGAVLSRLCRREENLLDNLDRPELEDILGFANRAAALTCSRGGAIPAMPTLKEVEDFTI